MQTTLALKRGLLLALLPLSAGTLVSGRPVEAQEFCYKIHPVTGVCESPALTGCSKGCKG